MTPPRLTDERIDVQQHIEWLCAFSPAHDTRASIAAIIALYPRALEDLAALRSERVKLVEFVSGLLTYGDCDDEVLRELADDAKTLLSSIDDKESGK